VYAVRPHTGRGGWTWYTGSAGWMYRLLVESLLGMRLEGNRLRFTPLWPAKWDSFTVDYRFHATPYHITVVRADETHSAGVTLDGQRLNDDWVQLVDDQESHTIEFVVGSRPQGGIPRTAIAPSTTLDSAHPTATMQ
jgi:cellobiose phosphorylase